MEVGGDGSFGALRLLRTTDLRWKAGSFACHSEHGATRSESEINMLAGGKHTAIQRRRVEESVALNCQLSIVNSISHRVRGGT